MPRTSSITDDLIAEVIRRRRDGQQWKVIAADLRRRGLPADRATWWRVAQARDVAQHLHACEPACGHAS